MGIQEKEYNRSATDERPARIARIFHLLGTDPQKNIDLILDQTLSIMEGFFSLYLRCDNQKKKPVIRAGSNLPWDLEHTLFPGGRLFKTGSISHGEHPAACIPSRETLLSDPLAKKYGLKACMGTPVFYKEKAMGTLWITDTHARSFTPEDIGCIQTLAAALGLEEERLTREKKLLAKKDRFKGFYDATSEAIFLSKRGICLDQNKTAFRMFGYSMEEAIGKPGTDWIFPADRKIVEKNMLSGCTAPYEITALRKDGTTFPAQIQASMADHGGDQLRVTVLRDISQLKEAQRSLVEEKEKYKILIDNVNDAIYIAQDGQIKFANPKTIELSGHTREDLQTIPFLDLVHPADREKIYHNYQKRLSGEIVPSPQTFRALNKQKENIWIQLSAVPIIWEGKPAVLGCARDISKIKELEEKLRQAEKMELLGVIAGGVAHDLNNILSGLVSYPELLLMQLEKNSPLVEPISFIHETGLKAAEIVQDLLTLTRRGVHQTSVLNLNQVIREYFNSSAHDRLEKNFPRVSFHFTSEPDLLNINGSEYHISKVVMNLVMNAAEAVLSQGQVLVEAFNRYVDQSVPGYEHIREGEYVILRVKDDGDGIGKGDLDRIFEPFYTKKQMGRSGTGLGLSVVWNAVKDHHGYIDVSSKKEDGTIFDLFFPATRDNNEIMPADFQIEAFKGNNETILVIDDITEQRKIAQECLRILGYTPYAAESGEAAVNFLKNHSVDLLILDMKMEPGMDGLETYKRILETTPNQKAIIASGFSETQRVKNALKLGAGQYIKKPYTLQKLAIALKKELEGTQ